MQLFSRIRAVALMMSLLWFGCSRCQGQDDDQMDAARARGTQTSVTAAQPGQQSPDDASVATDNAEEVKRTELERACIQGSQVACDKLGH